MKCLLRCVFLVYILHALFSWLSSSVFCGYFGCLCASLVDGAREWLLDAVGTWYPSLEEESRLYGFSCDCSFVGKIPWHRSRHGLPENGEHMVWVKDGNWQGAFF